jgi:hypothetical protein
MFRLHERTGPALARIDGGPIFEIETRHNAAERRTS